jgi:predicted MFS family arabinose efflux permease
MAEAQSDGPMATRPSRPSSLDTLRKSRGFIQLFTGQAISAFGDWMATIAFMSLTENVTHSPTAVGGVLILRLAPGVVAAPLAGRLARRFDYRKTMISMDAVRACMAVVVPFVLALWWIYLWAFLIEVMSLMFLPARDSSIPELVEDEGSLPLANSLILGSSYGTIPLGAGAFAVVAAFGQHLDFGFISHRAHPLAFWIDGLTFLASMYFIRHIQRLQTAHVVQPERAESAPEGKFHEALRIPIVRTMLPPMITIALGLGALFSLGIVLVREVMNASSAEFGTLIALFGVGAGSGLGLLQLRGSDRTIRDFQVSVAAAGAAVFLTVLTPFLYVAFVGAVFFGAAAAYALAGGMSTLQERLRGEERVLAFTAFHILIRAGLGLGAVAAGAISQTLGNFSWPLVGTVDPSQWVLFFSGTVVLASSMFIRNPPEGQEPR